MKITDRHSDPVFSWESIPSTIYAIKNSPGPNGKAICGCSRSHRRRIHTGHGLLCTSSNPAGASNGPGPFRFLSRSRSDDQTLSTARLTARCGARPLAASVRAIGAHATLHLWYIAARPAGCRSIG